MIKNVVFDIGNVLTDFRWEGFIRDQGFEGELFERIANATVRNIDWREFDRGAWGYDKTLETLANTDPEIKDIIMKAFADPTMMVTPRDYGYSWVKSLKEQGLGVYYLSNFSDRAREMCVEALRFMELCDGGIMSYEVKMIKPDAEIYEELYKRYNLNPDECVFIDDTAANIDAARRTGMHGIVFGTKEQVDADLADMLAGKIDDLSGLVGCANVHADGEGDGDAETEEYVTFTIMSKEGKVVELAVVDEFECAKKIYVACAVVEGDDINMEGIYIYRAKVVDGELRPEKITDKDEYSKVVAAYMEMEG